MATVLRTHSAFARLLVGKNGRILNNSLDLGAKLLPESQLALSSKHYSSYGKSPFVRKIKEQYNYEIEKNPPEWEYVKRLLPFTTIPKIIPKDSYPSGWVPPKEEALNHPYFLSRTKNAELPIYLKITYRGMRKISIIRKIEGDIWLLNDEIKQYLKQKNKRYVETRVHEVARDRKSVV